MNLTFQTNSLLKKKKISVNTKDGISVLYKSEVAAGFLMKEFIDNGVSVIVFGKKPDYYRYVKNCQIESTGSFSADDIKGLKWPWIENISEKTLLCMEDCFIEARTVRYGRHIQSLKDNTVMIKDPSAFLSFYQIDDAGNRRERIMAETLLMGIILQHIHKEPQRNICLFLDAPYHPFTVSALNTVKEADYYDIPIILIYLDDGKRYTPSKNAFIEKNGMIYLKRGIREHRIEDEKD